MIYLFIYLFEAYSYSPVNQPHRVTSRLFTIVNLTEVDLFIDLFEAYSYSPVKQLHRVTSGLFTKSKLTEVENTKHAHFTNVKHNPKVSLFGIVLQKNGKYG